MTYIEGTSKASPRSNQQPHSRPSTASLPRPLSEWNNPTQPPPRGGVPNGSQLGKAFL
ncbi:hypothetical protein HMPREF0973_01488 [Prevotella veroralis F0319]|uniref:Uncharacterized protein n=1 Tax=Prevotella veroralis F0319 TaxID=649761 RepID=C9MPE7_9BACT|nr:hypothetical protein HMPREF0973_01488 [Prevotella veroralis F0319]